MRRFLAIFCTLGLLWLFSNSCDDLEPLKEILSFESEDILIDFTIDPVDVPGYHIFKEKTFRPNLDSLFKAYDFDADRFESVTLVSALVEITGPSDTMSLNYLDMVKITIYTPELSEGTIAEKSKIPHDVKMIELEIMEGDMKHYLEEEEYILTVYGILNARSYEQRELEARIKYKFKMAPGF
jgi:hypothetical protein